MKRMITSGVRNTNDSYVFDYDNNSDVDIIDLVYPYLEESSIGKNIYYFGYKFKEDVSSKERSHFIKYIKGLSDEKVDQNELKKFIEAPLAELDRNTDIYHIDAFIYPISGRSNLVNDMIKVINSFTSRDNQFLLILNLIGNYLMMKINLKMMINMNGIVTIK